MLRTVTCQHQDDSYEVLYDTETYSFGVVWRFRNSPSERPIPTKFEDLPMPVQQKLENAVMKTHIH